MRCSIAKSHRWTLISILAMAWMALSTRADDKSGISTTGNPSACYSDDLKKVIQDCIQANMNMAPPGNPGPFTRGYKSMVFLLGQCYSGGLSSALTGIGDNIVVGAAASDQKESHNLGPKNDRRMEYLQRILDEIKKNPNRSMKDIITAAKAKSKDTADAMTPDAMHSNGGDSVVMGDPQNNQQPATSFHAVVFTGIAEMDTGSFDDLSTRLRHAHMKAHDDFKDILQNKLNVPAANIMSKFGGSYADLQMMIQQTWNKMNDNEQFILVIGDHGSRCCKAAQPAIVPQPGGNGVRTLMNTAGYMMSPNVVAPTVEIDTLGSLTLGMVVLNGLPIGLIPPLPGPQHLEFPIPPSALAPVGAPNQIDVDYMPLSAIQFEGILLATGPVAAEVPCDGELYAIGTGCPDGGGTPLELRSLDCPGLGMTFELEVFVTPGNFGPTFYFMGLSNTNWQGIPLPLDLVLLGSPGCLLYSDPSFQLGQAIPDPLGTATLPLPIPPDPLLDGLTLHFQAMNIEILGPRFMGTTNSLTAVLGQ